MNSPSPYIPSRKFWFALLWKPVKSLSMVNVWCFFGAPLLLCVPCVLNMQVFYCLLFKSSNYWQFISTIIKSRNPHASCFVKQSTALKLPCCNHIMSDLIFFNPLHCMTTITSSLLNITGDSYVHNHVIHIYKNNDSLINCMYAKIQFI